MNSVKNKPDAVVSHIGKYEIVDVLGRGGMGVVYRGIDKQIGREVAIKTITQGVAGDENMLARFYEEGRRTGRLNHPNIVTVYDLGDDEGTPYIVMERVEGEPLDKLIRSEAPIPLVERLAIVQQVCAALGYAHRHNVIHRDVKPANIFVQPDGSAKLLDFGIARLEKRERDQSLTLTGNLIGTVPYMAPERLRNEEVDGRSDIFAAGVVLFQLVAGQLPFSGADTVLMQRILAEPHPRLSEIRPELPASLELIVDRALAKRLDDRYPAAEEMAADLTAVIAELQQEQILEMLPEAEQLMEGGELARARAVLHQLLKIDSKHVGARSMLSEIQRRMSLRQREERIQQIRAQAEEAISNRRFDQSLAALEAGLQLDAANPELVKLRERAREEKQKQDRVSGLMMQAETARRKGDFKSALAATEEALKIDKTSSKILAFNNILAKEAAQAERQTRARALLDSARGKIGLRRYREAVEVLRQAEEIDPANPELPLLLEDVHSGVELERQREAIARLEEEVAQAASFEQLQKAARAVQEAMAALPSEAKLYRLNTTLERRIREYENRNLADETIQACRKLRPREALELVKKTRQRLPGDERLMNLEALLTERSETQSVDERRVDYLSRAREALEQSRYLDAVTILEDCRSEGIATGEILSLLDYARAEEQEHRRQKLLCGKVAQAQSLLSNAAYDEAIAFLEDELRQGDDAALRLLLEEAAAGRDALSRQTEAALATAAKMKLADAREFLRRQPAAILHSTRVQAALAAIEDDRAQALYRTMGRAYTGLESDLAASDEVMRRAITASAGSSVFAAIAAAFRARQQSVAGRLIAGALRSSHALLRKHDREGACEALKNVQGIVDFSSAEVKSEWQSALSRIAPSGLIARLRA